MRGQLKIAIFFITLIVLLLYCWTLITPSDVEVYILNLVLLFTIELSKEKLI